MTKPKLYEVYIDGSGDGKYGYWITKEGVFLQSGKPKVNKHEPVIYQSQYPITNNTAEYLALVAILKDISPGSALTIYSDSRLVVCQLRGYVEYPDRRCSWKTENPKFADIHVRIKQLVKDKNLNIQLRWVPREENKFGKVLDRIKRRNKRNRVAQMKKTQRTQQPKRKGKRRKIRNRRQRN